MRTGPQIECQSCRMPILLAFAVSDGATRELACPACGHVHLWLVNEVRSSPAGGVDGGGAGRTGLRSSVE